MASLLRIRAFIALIPTIARRIGMSAFNLSLSSNRAGKRSFFFKRPRPVSETSTHEFSKF